MSASWEEAKRCPRCGLTGEHMPQEDKSMKAIRGATIRMVYCRNSRCKWFNSAWTVQVSADGTIPPPLSKRDKKFPDLPSYGRKTIDALEEQLALETQSGAELNNPYQR